MIRRINYIIIYYGIIFFEFLILFVFIGKNNNKKKNEDYFKGTFYNIELFLWGFRWLIEKKVFI